MVFSSQQLIVKLAAAIKPHTEFLRIAQRGREVAVNDCLMSNR